MHVEIVVVNWGEQIEGAMSKVASEKGRGRLTHGALTTKGLLTYACSI